MLARQLCPSSPCSQLMEQYMNKGMCEAVTSAASMHQHQLCWSQVDWQQSQHISTRNKAVSQHYVLYTHASGPLA